VKSNDPFSDLNLIDWSPNNILAVALSSNVYLWNADTGSIQQLLTLEGSDFVCSVSWIQQGHYLAVGTSMGLVQVCYITKLQTVLSTLKLEYCDSNPVIINPLNLNTCSFIGSTFPQL
jgi:WD domain, G-beta repeat.